MNYLGVSLLLFSLCGSFSNDTGDERIKIVKDLESHDNNLFVPTKRWQVIKEGQSIPPGLHVRMNFQTGVKEAKLMDGPSDGGKAEGDVAVVSTEPTKNDNFVITAHHRAYDDSLKTLNDGVVDGEASTMNQESVATKFRSMETLKEELAELFDAKVETDAEIMKSLLRKYNESFRYSDQAEATEERIVILNNLEYYLHQYDNAIDFESMGGLNRLISDFARRGVEIRDGKNDSLTVTNRWMSAIAHCIGSALSSNPKIQIAAYKRNLLKLLLFAIESSNRVLESVEGDEVQSVLKLTARTYFSLAALTRNFPHAQRALLENGGVKDVADGMDQVLNLLRECMDRATIKSLFKLALKQAGFLTDLVTERRDFLQRFSADEKERDKDDEMKRKQYLEIDFESAIKDSGFCLHIAGLTDFVAEALTSEKSLRLTIDDVEKTFSAVDAFYKTSICQSVSENSLRQSLTLLRKGLVPLAEEEERDEGAEGDRMLRDLMGRVRGLIVFLGNSKSEL